MASESVLATANGNNELQVFTAKSILEAHNTALSLAVEKAVAGKVLWIDCINAFDPYAVLQLCNDSAKARELLKNILISRPFTVFQLQKLLEADLLSAIAVEKPVFVVFLGLTELFRDEDIPIEERIVILKKTITQLKILAEKKEFQTTVFLLENSFSELFLEVLEWEEQ